MSDTEKMLLEVINKRLIGKIRPAGSYTRAYFYWKKFQNVYRLFRDEIKQKNGPTKILDVGCGLGDHIFFLNQEFSQGRNLEFRGIDLDPLKIYYCDLKKEKYQTKNFSFSIDNAEGLSFPDNSFDILLAIEVLEHLKQPERVLGEFYRVLKPNGLAIITTPNKSTLVTKPKKLLKSTVEKLSKLCPAAVRKEMENLNPDTLNAHYEEAGYGHISVKSLKEWMKSLFEAGFKIERIKRGSLLVGTPQQDKQRAVVALLLLMEILLDRIPFLKDLSEDVIVSARKPV